MMLQWAIKRLKLYLKNLEIASGKPGKIEENYF